MARYGPQVIGRDATGATALDLPAAVRAALAGVGVTLSYDSDVCTACSDEHWSWRARGDAAAPGDGGVAAVRPGGPDPDPDGARSAPEPAPPAAADPATVVAADPVAVAPTDLAAVVAANLAAVRHRVAAAGRDPAEVAVVAVTKSFGPEAVVAAIRAGLSDCGENYAQELVAKATAVSEPVRWHFLGPVQRNKVAALSPHVHLWQAIDRRAAGEAVARRRPGASVLVQVNVTGLGGRPGCPPEETAGLVAALQADGLDVRGLMAVGPGGQPEAARPGFRRLAGLAGELGLGELSMGMSDDLEVAVQEGATMIRIGRALFGPRSGLRYLRR